MNEPYFEIGARYIFRFEGGGQYSGIWTASAIAPVGVTFTKDGDTMEIASEHLPKVQQCVIRLPGTPAQTKPATP